MRGPMTGYATPFFERLLAGHDELEALSTFVECVFGQTLRMRITRYRDVAHLHGFAVLMSNLLIAPPMTKSLKSSFSARDTPFS